MLVKEQPPYKTSYINRKSLFNASFARLITKYIRMCIHAVMCARKTGVDFTSSSIFQKLLGFKEPLCF